MIAAERQDFILQKARTNRVVLVQELAKELQTTEITIRRDFAALEKQGWLTRSYGGAVINAKVAFESDFAIRQAQQSEMKALLAKKAASFITPGDCIGIDVGTTTFEICRQLKNAQNLKVITASLPVVVELAENPGVEVICVGGELSQKDMSFTGHNAINTLQEYILDKAFVGVAGISFKHGYTLYNIQDALVKRVLIERAQETIVVAHSSKIGVERHAFMANIDAADILITDSGISEEDRKRFESFGVEVVIADAEEEEGTQAGE